MAEESIDAIITPGKSELNGTDISENSSADLGSLDNGSSTRAHHRRASIGSFHSGDCSIGNSINKSDSANSSRNTIPHYLRASTGSCHDFCKYGKKQEFEEKPWKKPLRKRIVKPSPEESNFVQITVSGGQKKEKAAKDTNHSPDPNPLPHTKSNSPKPKKPSNQNGISSGNKTRLPKYKPSPTEKSPSPDPPEIIKREIPLPSTKVELPSKNKLTDAEKKMDNQSKKPSSLVKSKPLKFRQSLKPSDNSDGVEGNTKSNSDGKTSGKMSAAARASARRISAPPAITLSPKLPLSKKAPVIIKSRKAGNLKSPSPLKDQNRVEAQKSNNEKVTEKTLHVIEMETQKTVPGSNSAIPSPPKPAREEDDEYSGTEEADEFVSDEKKSEVSKAKENRNKNSKKSRVVVPEDKHCSPVKLKFRSGKVVDPQSENNSPRKLRFRRGRVLGSGDGKGDLRRRNFKKAGANDAAGGAGISSEKVVLKHQDVQGKKDSQVLFNNVIEETASKLVESKKSKVKALVGAFETVISLQEAKPSSHAQVSGE